MSMIDDYFNLQQKIYDHFGYEEDWVVIPMDDSRQYFWRLCDDSVEFADTEDELGNECGNYHVNDIYRQRFLPKFVYEADDMTMIVVDTHTDGNKFLQIFSNTMKRDWEDMK